VNIHSVHLKIIFSFAAFEGMHFFAVNLGIRNTISVKLDVTSTFNDI